MSSIVVVVPGKEPLNGCVCVYVLNNSGNFHLKLLCHFKDIAVFALQSFLLPHTVVPFPIGGSGPPAHPKIWILVPTQVHNPNGTLISSSISVGFTCMTNRQTMLLLHVHLAQVPSAVMWPNNSKNNSVATGK